MGEMNQTSFAGGMDLLADDTHLADNKYRIGFNLRNRYDVLDLVPKSQQDTYLPAGVIQELVTFGTYLVAFVSGKAYYRLNTDSIWNEIDGFAMSSNAPRYWTVAIPVNTTNYVRYSAEYAGSTGVAEANAGITRLAILSGAGQGSLPGLLVQDNINQPQFIFIGVNGYPQARTTQKYEEWNVNYDDTTGVMTDDKREYVPIGNVMAWVDGILYIASQNGAEIYRSVSGRPLDFMVNVKPDGSAGGDATTTSYSVGVGGISCLRGLSEGSVFVAASNSNFAVSKNMTAGAPTIFGEYTFIRKYLFESTILSDRCIIDSLGDTRAIDITGVRSFNAVQQLQNEGRNDPFSSTIDAAFKGIIQESSATAAILYDNYELYGVNTIFGPAIAVYDTLNKCWTSFDTEQTGGQRIKIFAKIELTTRSLYAVTEDNKLYELYVGPTKSTAIVRTAGITSCSITQYGTTARNNNPRLEIKPTEFRVVLNNITTDVELTFTPLVNNRLTKTPEQTKRITYVPSKIPYTGVVDLPDVDTQLSNILISLPNCGQGWKVAGLLSWTEGSLVCYSMTMEDLNPMNPLQSQGKTK